MSLESLPTEIFEKEIRPHLRPRDIDALALVSKTLRNRLQLRGRPMSPLTSLHTIFNAHPDPPPPQRQITQINDALKQGLEVVGSQWSGLYLSKEALNWAGAVDEAQAEAAVAKSHLVTQTRWFLAAQALQVNLGKPGEKPTAAFLLISRNLGQPRPVHHLLQRAKKEGLGAIDEWDSYAAMDIRLKPLVQVELLTGLTPLDGSLSSRQDKEKNLNCKAFPKCGTEIFAFKFHDGSRQYLSFLGAEMEVVVVPNAETHPLKLLDTYGRWRSGGKQKLRMDGVVVAEEGWHLVPDPRRMAAYSESLAAPRPILGRRKRSARSVPAIMPASHLRLFAPAREVAHLIYDLLHVFKPQSKAAPPFSMTGWQVTEGISRRHNIILAQKHKVHWDKVNEKRQREGKEPLVDIPDAKKSSLPNVRGTTLLLLPLGDSSNFRFLVLPAKLSSLALSKSRDYMGLLGPISRGWHCFPEAWWRYQAEFLLSPSFLRGTPAISYAQCPPSQRRYVNIAASFTAVLVTNVPIHSLLATRLNKAVHKARKGKKKTRGGESISVVRAEKAGIGLSPTRNNDGFAIRCSSQHFSQVRDTLSLLWNLVEEEMERSDSIGTDGEVAAVVAVGIVAKTNGLHGLLQPEAKTFFRSHEKDFGEVTLRAQGGRGGRGGQASETRKAAMRNAGSGNFNKSNWDEFSLTVTARAQHPRQLPLFRRDLGLPA